VELVLGIGVGVTAAVGVCVVVASGLILAVGVTVTRVFVVGCFIEVVGLTVAMGVVMETA